MAGQNDSCESIVLKEYVLTGPKGDKGDKGDPGEAAQFPIEAVNISVTNAGYNNLQEVLDFLLYVAIRIDSFSTATTLYENRGVTDPSADFTMDFNWSITGTDISQTLVGPSEMTPITLTPGQRNVTATLTNFNTNETFTLTVDDGQTQPSSAINVVFTNKVYYGDAAIPGVTDETFIKSLNNSLQTSRNIAVPSSTSVGTYWWFALPVAYGTPVFKDGATGFAIDMETPIPFTAGNGNIFNNDLGYSEDYYLYRTTNDNLGSITVEVT